MAIDLSGIGKVGDYLKQSQLQFSAKHKIKTGQTLTFDAKKDEKNFLSQMVEKNNESSSSMSDSLKRAVIKNKLQSGRELSSDEMNYLKKHDEALYRKAKGAQDAREELKRDLSQAHTKAEARQAVMRAQMKAAGEAMAELSAAKSAMATGGGGMAGAGGAASAGGAMGDVSSASIMAEDGGAMTGVDVSISGVDLSAGTVPDAAPAANADTIKADIAAETAQLPPEAQEMLGQLLHDINSAVAEQAESASEADGSAEGAADEEKNQAAGTEQAGQAGQQSMRDEAMEILEALLYKLKAIARTWAEYSKTKEYHNMPENYT